MNSTAGLRSLRQPTVYVTKRRKVSEVWLLSLILSLSVSLILQPDSEMAQAGRSLEAYFSSCLREIFPSQAFTAAATVEESDSDEYEDQGEGPEPGFSWPDRSREQSHRKRKRRHSLNTTRRQHL